MIIPFGFLKKQDSGLPVGTELYFWDDAATPTPNEANTVNLSTSDGWEAYQNVALSVSSSEFINSLYSIEIDALVGASDISRLYFSVEIGETYRLTFFAKTNVSGDGFGRIRGGGGWVSNPSQITFNTTWTEYTVDVEANATTSYFQFYATFVGGNISDKTYIDNITMIKL